VSGGGPEDIDTSHVRTYQIYRGMSPTTSNRLEVSELVKLEFYDADTDTDTDILARITAVTSDTRD